jgi:hypothetical protein
VVQATSIVEEGKTRSIFSGALTGSGTATYTLISKASNVVLSVFASAVTTSIKIDMYTGSTNKSVKIVDVPSITAPSTELQIYSPEASMSNCYVTITWVGDATLEVLVKGTSGGSGGGGGGVTAVNNYSPGGWT